MLAKFTGGASLAGTYARTAYRVGKAAEFLEAAAGAIDKAAALVERLPAELERGGIYDLARRSVMGAMGVVGALGVLVVLVTLLLGTS